MVLVKLSTAKKALAMQAYSNGGIETYQEICHEKCLLTTLIVGGIFLQLADFVVSIQIKTFKLFRHGTTQAVL